MTRSITTTGERLVEDVKRLYCLLCEGLGYVESLDWDNDAKAYHWDRQMVCPDCNGFDS